MSPATKLPVPKASSVPPPLNLAWLRLGVRLAVAGYAVMLGYGLWADSDNPVARWEELSGLVVTASALAFVARRPRVAVSMVLATVWCLTVLSILQWGYYGGGALVALPAVIIGAGMALGPRGAAYSAAACCLALPLAYLFPGFLLRGGSAFDFRNHGSLLITSEVVFVATAVLVRAFVSSYHEALEKSERARKRYGELFALAPDGLLELDERSVVRDVNAAALRLLDAERADVAGETLEWLLKRAGADGPVNLAEVKTGVPLVVTLHPAEALPRVLEISVQQRLGSEQRTMLIVRDVSARRRLEEQLAHTQRMETVGRLAGGVAHDFNNLLTVVGGNAGLLADHPDPEVRELVGEIEEAHRRGAALTRQLLAFARRDLRKPEVLDLGEAVQGMSRLIERLLGVQHRLVLELAGPVLVRADRGQVEQVLLNLTGNARDALPSGGVVTVRCRGLDQPSALALGSSLGAERQALLEVVDGGVGMPPEVQARLFEPFFTTKPRGQGTGLGLSMVHGIVLQNEGAVQIVSAVGQGTTVRVFLPASAEAERPATAAVVPEVLGPVGAEHVLVVEDEVAVRRFVERALVDGGYRVTNANDSNSALAVFAAAQPPIDLVLTDIVMPGMSGLELATKLGTIDPSVPVLFMSGHFEAGKDGPELDPSRNLLVKPFSADELRRRVRERLNGSVA